MGNKNNKHTPKIFGADDEYDDNKVPAVASLTPTMFWSGSLGQAAALATKYQLIETRFNPSEFKPGQVQFGFMWSRELIQDAGDYFTHKYLVDALAYWDKIFELRTLKQTLISS